MGMKTELTGTVLAWQAQSCDFDSQNQKKGIWVLRNMLLRKGMIFYT